MKMKDDNGEKREGGKKESDGSELSSGGVEGLWGLLTLREAIDGPIMGLFSCLGLIIGFRETIILI